MIQSTTLAIHQFLEKQVLAPLNWPTFMQVVLPYQYGRPTAPDIATEALPALTCAAVGGDPDKAVPLCASWIMYLLAARLFDDVHDVEGLWVAQPGLSLTDMTSFGLFAIGAAQSSLSHLTVNHQAEREISQMFGNALSLAARAQTETVPLTELSAETYFKVIAGKTGIIFAAAAWSGARLVGDDPLICQALYDYGLHTGMMIQILDDCRDLETDLPASPWTLPLIYALAQATPQQARTLQTWLSAPDNSATPQLFSFLQESGALSWSRQMARLYQQKALKTLEILPRKQTEQLREYITRSEQ